MICPSCSAESWQVLRTIDTPAKITRRRKCRQCGHRVTTAEKLVTGTTSDTTATDSGALEKSIAQLVLSAGLATDGGLKRLASELHWLKSDSTNQQE